MKKPGSILLFVLTIVFAAGIALADTAAIRTIAQIVKTINHHPTEADKGVLRRIVADETTTPDERAIASAVLQMNHQVTDGDREKLQAVKDDAAATPAERELADIVMGFNHQATPQQRERLDKL